MWRCSVLRQRRLFASKTEVFFQITANAPVQLIERLIYVCALVIDSLLSLTVAPGGRRQLHSVVCVWFESKVWRRVSCVDGRQKRQQDLSRRRRRLFKVCMQTVVSVACCEYFVINSDSRHSG